MSFPKENTNCLSAFALREFVLRIVANIMKGAGPAAPWNTQDEGVAAVEEIMLEGRACGFETFEGFEALCRTVIAFQIKLPLSKAIRQILTRAGLNEMQRIEGFRLSLINNRSEPDLIALHRSFRN